MMVVSPALDQADIRPGRNPADPDPELVCVICGAILCPVEPGCDSLGSLARVAEDHCNGCHQTTGRILDHQVDPTTVGR